MEQIKEEIRIGYLYEVKDVSGGTRHITIPIKRISKAIKLYQEAYQYEVESITYLRNVRIL